MPPTITTPVAVKATSPKPGIKYMPANAGAIWDSLYEVSGKKVLWPFCEIIRVVVSSSLITLVGDEFTLSVILSFSMLSAKTCVVGVAILNPKKVTKKIDKYLNLFFSIIHYLIIVYYSKLIRMIKLFRLNLLIYARIKIMKLLILAANGQIARIVELTLLLTLILKVKLVQFTKITDNILKAGLFI